MELFQKLFNKEKNKNKDKKDLTTNQFLTEPTPYRFTPSFIKHNGLYAAIVKLYIKQGTNRNMSYTEILDFVPTSTITGVDIHFMVDDVLIKDDEKNKIITNNSSINLAIIKDDDRNARKKQESGKIEETQDKKILRESEQADYLAYQSIIGNSEPVAVYRWSLLIIGESMELVDEQIRQLNTRLAKSHDGAVWDSLPGEQAQLFENLFGGIDKDRFNNTTWGSNYAGLNVSMSAGLLDAGGIPIGKDVYSPAHSTAFFDFELGTQSQAIVSMPKNAALPMYYKENEENQISASSIIAQTAANHIVMAGHKAHHIVLNDFNYFEPNMFYRPQESAQVFKHYDVSKVTINLMQGFGELSDVHNAYHRLRQKIVNVFNIMRDLELTDTDESIIMGALEKTYTSLGYWSAEADIFPERTNIVEIQNPQIYMTATDFLNKFTVRVREALTTGLLNKADRADTLKELLDTALSSYRSVVGRHTSIESTDAIQVYYDFSTIHDMKLKQIQYINMLEYIVHTAKRGDVIVIHGYDSLYEQVSRMGFDTIDAAKERGVRFIFAFDCISSTPNAKGIKMSDMFNMQGTYYADLDVDVSWSVIGRSLPADVDKVQKALNTDLSTHIIESMQAKFDHQALVHRRIGQVNSFVHFNPVI